MAIDSVTGLDIDAGILEVIQRDTLPRYFWRKAAERGGRIAMREKHLGIV